MTRADHQSGTERLAEVVEKCGFSDDTVIVNVQGDEPMIPVFIGYDRREIALVGWVGLRGAVSIFLATVPILSGIPGGIAYGSFIVTAPAGIDWRTYFPDEPGV